MTHICGQILPQKCGQFQRLRHKNNWSVSSEWQFVQGITQWSHENCALFRSNRMHLQKRSQYDLLCIINNNNNSLIYEPNTWAHQANGVECSGYTQSLTIRTSYMWDRSIYWVTLSLFIPSPACVADCLIPQCEIILCFFVPAGTPAVAWPSAATAAGSNRIDIDVGGKTASFHEHNHPQSC